jgi:hypothetical protein
MVNEVTPGEIQKAAARLGEAVTAVRSHIPTEVGQIADALPGGESAAPASKLSTTWATRYGDWAKGAEAQAKTMNEVAKNWTKVDDHIAAEGNKQAGRVQQGAN